MQTFQIELNRIGEVTALPDSQRLFGFLISLLDKKENEQIDEMARDILAGKKVCMVSNIMPLGYYPTPKNYIMSKLENYLFANEQRVSELEEAPTSSKDVYGAIKEMDFIKKKDLEKLLAYIVRLSEEDGNLFKAENLEEYSYIRMNRKYIQKFHIESQSKKLPGLPNIAYSLPILSLYKAGRDNGERKNMVSFCFYISIDENSILTKKLMSMSSEEKLSYPCFLGNKASSGYNEYEITRVVRIEDVRDLNIKVKHHGAFSAGIEREYLNLGMLLPNGDAIDWAASILDIISSDRKPYEISNEKPKVISFINAGSVVVEVKNKEIGQQMGKCIRNQYNPLYQNAMIFGNSFLVELEG